LSTFVGFALQTNLFIIFFCALFKKLKTITALSDPKQWLVKVAHKRPEFGTLNTHFVDWKRNPFVSNLSTQTFSLSQQNFATKCYENIRLVFKGDICPQNTGCKHAAALIF